MKSVLIITDVDFWVNASGHRKRISALIKYLALHVDLTVVKVGPVKSETEEYLKINFKVKIHFLEKKKFLDSTGYGRRLKIFLQDKKFNTIIIEYIHCSYFLNSLLNDVQVILDAHDIINERYEEFKKYETIQESNHFYHISKQEESEIFKIYDYVIALCSADQKKINLMTGKLNALLCPHPEVLHNHTIKNEVKTISYIASSYLPNGDAINFFLKQCWPQISSKHQVQLKIYGTICDMLDISEYQNVLLEGFVSSEHEIYQNADIIINPVRYGAGVKIKNIEALAHGRPLITTNHGARGLEQGVNISFFTADEPEQIIHLISLLVDNAQLRSRLSKNAHLFIKENFSSEKCFSPLLNAINFNH